MVRLAPQLIRPYKLPPRNLNSTSPAPLIFNETAQLEAYLPPPRSNYLEESPITFADSEDAILPYVTLTYAQSLDAQSTS